MFEYIFVLESLDVEASLLETAAPLFSRIPPFELLKGPFRFEGRSWQSDNEAGLPSFTLLSKKYVHELFLLGVGV